MGDRAESQKKQSMRKVESTQGWHTSQPDPQLGFLVISTAGKKDSYNAIAPTQAHRPVARIPAPFRVPSSVLLSTFRGLPAARHCTLWLWPPWKDHGPPHLRLGNQRQ